MFTVQLDNNNQDKTVKSVCDAKETSRKWTRKGKLNMKWQAAPLGLPDTEKGMLCKSLVKEASF